MIDVLDFINDVIQATAVIFGSAVILYYLRLVRRDRVTRAFVSLLTFVMIVFLTELMASRTAITESAEPWLRLGWVGIAMVPAAQYHLSDALIVTTGAVSRGRRLFVRVCYITGIVFIGLVAVTDLIVKGLVDSTHAPHLQPGILFPLFVVYFWGVSLLSIYNVWHARKRCLTRTTRRRMTMILAAFMAAPLGVFPYLQVSSRVELGDSIVFWLFTIIGNMVVGLMFALLTYYMAYFGAVSPDRVVRVRLFKFMARVPLAATIVLLVYVIVGRTSSLLGLPVETAQAFAIVATIILVEGAIHIFKRPLERLFSLNSDPEVWRIQQLSDRLLTTRDMHQFLESVLITTCEYLRTPSAFIAAITPEGAKLEMSVGNLVMLEPVEGKNLRELAARSTNGHPAHMEDPELTTVEDLFIWQGYWIRTLFNRQSDALVGILGVEARARTPDLTPAEQVAFGRLARQTAEALEDRILQQEVFAAVEGLLPQIIAIQERRSAATYSGDTLLIAPLEPTSDQLLLADPDFSAMVRDALSHYWGGPKLSNSPLVRLKVVQRAMEEHDGNTTRAMRAILEQAIDQQKPEGERSMTTAEWILYNILELKFVQGQRVRDVARRLAMSESDLYRKQRIAIENVAGTIAQMERDAHDQQEALEGFATEVEALPAGTLASPSRL